MIAEKKKAGWTFAFLGADMDAYAVSAAMGISKGNTMNYASAQTQTAFGITSTSTSNYLRNGGKQTDSYFNNPSTSNADPKKVKVAVK